MSNLKVNSINDASGGNNAVLYGVASPPNSMGFRNRIINGEMRIDQRNAGASIAFANNTFPVDRFVIAKSSTAVGTAQQSTTAPAGFTNSLLITCTTGASPSAAEYNLLWHNIEGVNVADLGWGTSSAQAVTVSFWVRSSLTGTFAATAINGSYTRSYVFNYTVSTANTLEFKTITIPGDTSGTWGTNNSTGIKLSFDLGSGSNSQGAAGAWGALYYTTSGAQKVMATTGATFYITGVQLEAGTVASSFERRDYGRELMMCQRYLPVFNSSGSPSFVGLVAAQTSTSVFCTIPFLVTPRVAPTGISVSSASHFQVVIGAAGPIPSAITFNQGSFTAGMVNAAVAGVTAGTAGVIYATSASGQIQFTGCEL
jgi:hypothetical protein